MVVYVAVGVGEDDGSSGVSVGRGYIVIRT